MVSGDRTVWIAHPEEDVSLAAYEAGAYLGATTFLPEAYDPSCNGYRPKKGVRWRKPVHLEAGDAIWIKAGWWHCILSEADGVAVPIDVKLGMVVGETPHVFRHAAPSKSGRGKHSERRVSRRPRWGDAASVLKVWSHAFAEAAVE